MWWAESNIHSAILEQSALVRTLQSQGNFAREVGFKSEANQHAVPSVL
jgi:hypothetical protein